MEDKLFYAYLKYQKDTKRNAWSNLLNLHWTVGVPFAISIASTISTLVLTFVSPLSGWQWISVTLMALGCIVLAYSTENFQIKRSHEEFVGYCEYCAEMKAWLEGFSIDNKEKTEKILARISAKTASLRNSCKKNTEGIAKGLQGFVIPIVLAIVSAVIAGEDATEEKFAMTFIVVLLFALSWYLCSIGAKMMNFDTKKKAEQLECFASDLQGILDTQFEGGIAYQVDDTCMLPIMPLKD